MALLLLLLAAATTKADDCATTPPTKPQKEVEAYLRALYPSTQSARPRKRRRAFRSASTTHLRGPKHTGAAAFLSSKQVPPLPYVPEGAYYAAKPAHRNRRSGRAARSKTRWRAPVRRRHAAQSAVRRVDGRRPLRPGALVDEPPGAGQVPVSPLYYSKGAEPGRAPRRGDAW